MADCKIILGLWSTLFSIHVDGSVDVGRYVPMGSSWIHGCRATPDGVYRV